MTEGHKMDRHWAYCSACDRQVEVLVRAGARRDPESGEPANEIVCLAIGESCTGALCPISDLPPEEMREALERAHRTDADPSGEE